MNNQQSNNSNNRAWLGALMLRDPGRWSSRLGALVSWMKMIGRGQRRRFGRAAAGVLAGASGIALMALLAGPMAPRAYAATINIDATCSLVDAIKSANTDTAIGTCEAGSGADTIILAGDVEFSTAVGEYYSSLTALPLITSTVTIESAAGEHYTISRDAAAADKFRLFAVGASGDLTLRNLTVSNGYAYNVARYTGSGGAVYGKDGDVRLDTVILSDNQAKRDGGAIAVWETDSTDGVASPELVISNSVIDENLADIYGGGIFVRGGGHLTITHSLISNNEAEGNSGGGIHVYAGLSGLIEYSTISDNRTPSWGGGIDLYSNYYAPAITFEINNTTFTGNETWNGDGGAIRARKATVNLNHVTISDNYAHSEGGGVYSSSGADITIRRSIISGNREFGKEDNEIDEDSGTIRVYDSVLGHGGQTYSQAFSSISLDASNTIATSDRDNIPLAAILKTAAADNGGPTLPGDYVMMTHNLVAGSPAVDMTDAPCTLDEDQRGVSRPQGAGCDAGAVEFIPTYVLISTLEAGSVDGLDYDANDILQWDGVNWTKWFTGTAAGLNPARPLRHNINALSVSDMETGDIYLSFLQTSNKLPGISSKVGGTDVVLWDGSAFSLWFEGRDVGLNVKGQEKIDGLHVMADAPTWSEFSGDNCEAYLLISTHGPGLVPKPGNVKPKNALKFGGEDVLGFCATNLGASTTGLWEMVLDGSVEGVEKNNIDSISMDTDGTKLFLTSRSFFSVDQAFGGHSMVFAYDLEDGSFDGPYVRMMDDLGLQTKVDALNIDGKLELP